MRVYTMLMTLGLVSMLLIGFQLSASPTTTSIKAEVNIHPEVFNLKRNDTQRGVITAYISNLTKEGVSYDVRNVNLSTIKLDYDGNNITQALRTTIANDTIIAKFDAAQVAGYIWTHIAYHMGIIQPQQNFTRTFTVKGELSNGEQFEGSDTIKIIYPTVNKLKQP